MITQIHIALVFDKIRLPYQYSGVKEKYTSEGHRRPIYLSKDPFDPDLVEFDKASLQPEGAVRLT